MLQVASSTINTKSKPKIEEPASNREIKTRLLKMGRKRKFKKRLHEEIDIPPRKALPIDETEHSLCVLLWQSTIVQALYDLANESSGAEAKLTKAEAANWFFVTPQSSDFELVCELACLSPAKVLKMARKVAKQGEKALEGFNFRTIRRDLSDRAPTKRTRKK